MAPSIEQYHPYPAFSVENPQDKGQSETDKTTETDRTRKLQELAKIMETLKPAALTAIKALQKRLRKLNP